MSNNDDQIDSDDFQSEDNKLTKKKVMRTLGKRAYKRPISRKEITNSKFDLIISG